MRAIITAAGSGSRWNNYLGVRKHLARIDGERLLPRLVRMLRQRGVVDIVVTCHPDHLYSVDGARSVAMPVTTSNAEARLLTQPFWNTDGRTLVLLGDVYVTDAAMDIMTRQHYVGWTHFARLSPSAVTGKPGAEMFGCSFLPEDHDVYADALRRAGPGSDWPAYCAFTGHPVDTEPNDIRDWGHHVEIPDDGTDDFDFADDFERFMFHRGRSARIVRVDDFSKTWFLEREREMALSHKLHRKLWEHCSIAQAYKDRLGSGGLGLGFGVGKEPLPAWFAAQGADVLATDRPDPGVWLERQHATGALDLRYEGICSLDTLRQKVRFSPVDMRDLSPALFGQFDFTWSTSSFEHVGGIRAGLEFFMAQMQCLKPGGLAFHTTEYNLRSNDRTIDGKDLCVFRQKDLLELTQRLHAQGDRLWPIELVGGSTPPDLHIDKPPFQIEPHLKLELGGHTFTSVLLIAAKGVR